mgnify:CR=1 FL=1
MTEYGSLLVNHSKPTTAKSALNITYQAVHKALQEMDRENVVSKITTNGKVYERADGQLYGESKKQ